MFIGVVELLGAIGVVVPMAMNIDPWLTPLAATGLAIAMLLAVVYHVRRKEPPMAPAVLMSLALLVAVGRFSRMS
jgi:hypothetical protein